MVNQARIKRRAYRFSVTRYTEEEWKEAEREKSRVIKQTQTLYFRRAVYKVSLSPKGVWLLARYGRERSYLPKALLKFLAIKDGDTMAEDFESKTKALRKVFFPPLKEVDLSDIPGAKYLLRLGTDEGIITEEVRKVIRRPAADKALGPSGIPNRFLTAITPEEGGLIE